MIMMADRRMHTHEILYRNICGFETVGDNQRQYSPP